MDFCPTWSPSRAGTLDKTSDPMSNVEQYMSVEIGGAPAAPPLKRFTDPRAHLVHPNPKRQQPALQGRQFSRNRTTPKCATIKA